MGSGISKLGDLFYPDNPNRRARARQLNADIEDYCRQFEEYKKNRDQVIQEIKPRLSQLLNKYGYNSPDELDQAVQGILKGNALAEYLKIRQQIDKSNDVLSTAFQIVGIVSVGSGLIVGGLVLFGIMTGGTALAVIKGMGAVLGIFAGLLFLFGGLFEGAQERANLRQCIHDLALERVKARAALEAMKAISNWVESIKMWLDEPLISENENLMKKKIEGDFTTDFSKSKRPYIVQYLSDRDRERGAWTNEDPNWRSGSYDILEVGTGVSGRSEAPTGQLNTDMFPIEASTIACEYSNVQERGILDLTFMSSDEKTCKAVDPEKNEWLITYQSGADNQPDPTHPKLENFRFILKNITSGKVLDGCELRILRTTLR
ncbi:hypothetical protein AX16_002603 [Volvariella volvacea WC 439]|nr:hypothetical protein AX16_002603 [Volvariella volvacea WC 439]